MKCSRGLLARVRAHQLQHFSIPERGLKARDYMLDRVDFSLRPLDFRTVGSGITARFRVDRAGFIGKEMAGGR